jgi:hypothetical protein
LVTLEGAERDRAAHLGLQLPVDRSPIVGYRADEKACTSS